MSPRAILSMVSRQARLSSTANAFKGPIQRRFASSEPQQPSPLSQFYKDFTRPVAKVLLMAMLTYQLAYWGWVKLEQDEIRAEREGEVQRLEAQVAKLTGKPLA
ncbi:hypothetical protein DHEL01_v208498 [Diaporthe helianthi]|uniref:Inner membrane assembly complex subunit 17 n=1 Tax=Diaporthe helianthi TaxID=158607 RepID=A0A2P5HS64_DIAHE|nr:hypothetical protein DHEL01_v208498 [Diaporthe helianthi]